MFYSKSRSIIRDHRVRRQHQHQRQEQHQQHCYPLTASQYQASGHQSTSCCMQICDINQIEHLTRGAELRIINSDSSIKNNSVREPKNNDLQQQQQQQQLKQYAPSSLMAIHDRPGFLASGNPLMAATALTSNALNFCQDRLKAFGNEQRVYTNHREGRWFTTIIQDKFDVP